MRTAMQQTAVAVQRTYANPGPMFIAMLMAWILFGACLAPEVTAARGTSAGQASNAVAKIVERRYARILEGRFVFSSCRRVHDRLQFSCRYGVLGNFEDGEELGEEGMPGPYVASGLAQVYVRGGSLSVELIGPLRWGGAFAP